MIDSKMSSFAIALLLMMQVAAADGPVGAMGDRVGPIEKVLERWRKDQQASDVERDRKLFERLRVANDGREAKLFGALRRLEESQQAYEGFIADWRKERAEALAEMEKAKLARAELAKEKQRIKHEMAEARRTEAWAKAWFIGAMLLLVSVAGLIGFLAFKIGISSLLGLLFSRGT